MSTLKQVGNYLFSFGLGSAVVFGAGYNSTLDAVIATVIWIMLVISIIGLILITVVTFVVGANESKEHASASAPFYKALRGMQNGVVRRIILITLSVYWIYGFVIHEWTATAVMYIIVTVYSYAFVFMTKDIVKQYFINSLKGSSA